MSFESSRSLGRTVTLLIIISPIISLIISFSVLFFQPLSNSLYLSIVFSIFSFAAYILFLAAMDGLAKYYEDPRNIQEQPLRVHCHHCWSNRFHYHHVCIPSSNIKSVDHNSYHSGRSCPFTLSFFISSLWHRFFWLSAFVIALVQGIFYRRAFYALAEKSGESKLRQAFGCSSAER